MLAFQRGNIAQFRSLDGMPLRETYLSLCFPATMRRTDLLCHDVLCFHEAKRPWTETCETMSQNKAFLCFSWSFKVFCHSDGKLTNITCNLINTTKYFGTIDAHLGIRGDTKKEEAPPAMSGCGKKPSLVQPGRCG